MKLALLLSLTVVLSAAHHARALTELSDWSEGLATFYGGAPDGMSPGSPSYGTKEGACGYGLLDQGQWPYWSVGALAGGSSFAGGTNKGCGTCMEVTCIDGGAMKCNSDPSKRSIVIMITDTCPECASNQLDLQAKTWEKIAEPSPGGGRINIKFRRVECAPPQDMVVNVDNNRGGSGWIRLQVTKAGGRALVKQVELQGSEGGGWQAMNNVWGASWESASIPQPPLNIRITDDMGNTVTATGVIQGSETGALPTSVQFKMSSPGDVQPSGQTLGSASSIQSSVSAGRNGTSSDAGAPAVQAFSGPPDDSEEGSSPSSPSPSPSQSPSSG